MTTATAELESRRRAATKHLDDAHRSQLGQFFTPEPVARFMASLFELRARGKPLSILDPGAGIGSLSAALLARLQGHGVVTAYEVEPSFQDHLRDTLGAFPGEHVIVQRDFIAQTVMTVAGGRARGGLFDAVIANPPYKKIQTGSMHRGLMRKLGLETSNLYTCFLACAVALCKPGAQVVAIIPRSWMNGPYFLPFRHWLFSHAALTHIHVFESRSRAFKDDDVLQENVIIRLVVGAPQGEVHVSASHDATFTDLAQKTVPFAAVVTPGDELMFVHIPAPGAATTEGLPGHTLREIGLDVCTGPVVDFRLRDHLRSEPGAGSVPLLYSTHFNGQFDWPKPGRKPNAIMVNEQTRGWLMPNGCYVVLRRFTSKEEKRRVVAYLLDEGALPGALVGFENHQITPEMRALVQTVGTSQWRDALSLFRRQKPSLAERYANERKMAEVPLTVEPGKVVNLSPGEHSVLIRQIWEVFGARFARGGKLIYVGDTENKWGYFDAPALSALGIEPDNHGKFPDVVIHVPGKNWLLLCESVTSHGPVDGKRHQELKRLFAGCKAGIVYVTAFPTRAAMAKYLPVIAWETEVWCAESPTHIIHFNGERFLGPY